MGVGLPGSEPMVLVIVAVAIGWTVISQWLNHVDGGRASRTGRFAGWWRRQARSVRSRLSIGAVLFLIGVSTLLLMRLENADPFSGQVMLAVVALGFGAAQLVSGVISAE